MQIFMMGATGVIGRRAVPLLLERGHALTIATHTSRSPSVPWIRDVRVRQVDLFDVAGLTSAVAGHDTVINMATHIPSSVLAMTTPWGWRTNDRIRREGSRNLVRAAVANDVQRLIQESVALTYPDSEDRWIDERVPIDPARYNRTVADAEHSAEQFRSAGGSSVILRFGTFYGPDSTQLPLMIRALRWGVVPMPGSSRGYISSVSHDDAAGAVVSSLTAPSGTYNVVDDEPVTRQTYFRELAALIGAPRPHFLPRCMRFLFGVVGEPMSRSLRLTNARLKRATGWAPRYPSICVGLPATFAEIRRDPCRSETV